MTFTIALRTENLEIRPLSLDDVTPDYVAWLNDERVNQYLESRFENHTLQNVERYVSDQLSNPDVVFAAMVDGTDRHIGNIKLGPINWYHRRGDIGILIGEPDAWGRGYATEAISAFSTFAFEEVGVERLTAGAYVSNQASIGAFQKAGFKIEGTLRQHAVCGPDRVDSVILGLLNDNR